MTPSEAIKIIGTQEDADYFIEPAKHADLYDTVSPPLAALLRSGKISAIAGEYVRRDQQALAAQRSYKTLMERANCAVFGTAALSSLMMGTTILAGPLGLPAMASTLGVATLGILSGLAGATAAMWLYLVREGKLLECW